MSKTDTIRKRKIKKNVDASMYANIETAETYDSELNPGESICMEVETDEVVLTFANFVSYDATFEEELCWLLNPATYRRYKLMSCWLHTPFNVVLSGNNRPHTLDTLAKAIRLSRDETTRFIKSLVAMGLIVHAFCPESGFDKKIYMMNPFVTRKRKIINIKLLEIFTDIRHEKPKAKIPKKSATKNVAQLRPEQAN